MKADFTIKPIPKYILSKIQKLDEEQCPEQQGAVRFYSYLTTVKKDLFKITVAVKNYKKQSVIKQVAVHGVKSDRCLVKDMEYGYIGYGFRIGWHAEGLYKTKKWFEDGKWYDADSHYYNPYAQTVNIGYIDRFPQYKYSAYRQFNGVCIIEYLKLYQKYPQAEYLLKLGLHNIHNSVTILKRIVKDKQFCRWLIANKAEIKAGDCYIGAIMKAYKSGKPIKQVQMLERCKKHLIHDSGLQPIRELFKGNDRQSGSDLERFFLYLEQQKTDPHSYLDYLNACNYLKLDMTLPKNRFPHDFKRYHDIRIDEVRPDRVLLKVA